MSFFYALFNLRKLLYIIQSFSEYFNGGCSLQPPLWFWGQIALRMVFPIASAALCFMPDVEWT